MEAESAETVREALRKKNLTVEQVLEIPSANDDPAIGFTGFTSKVSESIPPHSSFG